MPRRPFWRQVRNIAGLALVLLCLGQLAGFAYAAGSLLRSTRPQSVPPAEMLRVAGQSPAIVSGLSRVVAVRHSHFLSTTRLIAGELRSDEIPAYLQALKGTGLRVTWRSEPEAMRREAGNWLPLLTAERLPEGQRWPAVEDVMLVAARDGAAPSGAFVRVFMTRPAGGTARVYIGIFQS